METKWFYEMINLMTVITGNVQLTSAENEGRSELDLFLNIQKSHCRAGSTLSSCGRLTSLIKSIATDRIVTSYGHHGTSEVLTHLRILHGNLKLGGRGKTIEIDESFIHSCCWTGISAVSGYASCL